MRTPKIIKGAAFDWEEAQKFGKNAVDGDGNVNWMAASFADLSLAPAVLKAEDKP